MLQDEGHWITLSQERRPIARRQTDIRTLLGGRQARNAIDNQALHVPAQQQVLQPQQPQSLQQPQQSRQSQQLQQLQPPDESRCVTPIAMHFANAPPFRTTRALRKHVSSKFITNCFIHYTALRRTWLTAKILSSTAKYAK